MTVAVAAYRRRKQRIKNTNQLALVLGLLDEEDCYEPLERFIGISHKHWNNGKIMGDKSAIIPLDIRNGVILTSKG